MSDNLEGSPVIDNEISLSPPTPNNPTTESTIELIVLDIPCNKSINKFPEPSPPQTSQLPPQLKPDSSPFVSSSKQCEGRGVVSPKKKLILPQGSFEGPRITLAIIFPVVP